MVRIPRAEGPVKRDGRGVFIPKALIDCGKSFWSVREAVVLFLWDRTSMEIEVGDGKPRIGLVNGGKPVTLAEIAAGTGAGQRRIIQILKALAGERFLIRHLDRYGQRIAVLESPRRFNQRKNGRRQVLLPHQAHRLLRRFPEIRAQMTESVLPGKHDSAYLEGPGKHDSAYLGNGDSAGNQHDSRSQVCKKVHTSPSQHIQSLRDRCTHTPPPGVGGGAEGGSEAAATGASTQPTAGVLHVQNGPEPEAVFGPRRLTREERSAMLDASLGMGTFEQAPPGMTREVWSELRHARQHELIRKGTR